MMGGGGDESYFLDAMFLYECKVQECVINYDDFEICLQMGLIKNHRIPL